MSRRKTYSDGLADGALLVLVGVGLGVMVALATVYLALH